MYVSDSSDTRTSSGGKRIGDLLNIGFRHLPFPWHDIRLDQLPETNIDIDAFSLSSSPE